MLQLLIPPLVLPTILNNNELQLPNESRNSFVMRADAQILSSRSQCPYMAPSVHLSILSSFHAFRILSLATPSAPPAADAATAASPRIFGRCFVLCPPLAIVLRIAYNFWFPSLTRCLLNLITFEIGRSSLMEYGNGIERSSSKSKWKWKWKRPWQPTETKSILWKWQTKSVNSNKGGLSSPNIMVTIEILVSNKKVKI